MVEEANEEEEKYSYEDRKRGKIERQRKITK
jgi:hypothetical protein